MAKASDLSIVAGSCPSGPEYNVRVIEVVATCADCSGCFSEIALVVADVSPSLLFVIETNRYAPKRAKNIPGPIDERVTLRSLDEKDASV